jgi:hypothetical protein
MKLNASGAIALALCASACAKGTDRDGPQASSPIGRLWGDDQPFISTLGKRHDANLLRLAQSDAAEEAQRVSPSRRSVPPSMYRTTEPPLPEPDLSLPVTDVPRSAPTPTPKPSPSPTPAGTPGAAAGTPIPGALATPSGSPQPER